MLNFTGQKHGLWLSARLGVTALMLLLLVTTSFGQSRKVSGTVTDPNGEAVVGANVLIKGTANGTIADVDGNYSLEVPDNKDTLVFTFIGMATKEEAIGNRTTVNVVLDEGTVGLNEVVVTALGIERDKSQLTYSTQQVKGEELTRTKEPNVLNAMTGKVSGVQITSSTGQPGSSSRIVIRGTSSLLGDNQALIVLDGVPINNGETGNAGSGAGISRLSDIDPNIIESINVLKGSAASALYGSKAARGVVIITTKGGGEYKKPTINFTSQFSLEDPILPEVQEKYALGDRGVYADGDSVKSSLVWGPEIAGLTYNGQPVRNVNPMEEFFQTGKTFTNTLSVQGGNEKSNYFISYSYLDQSGTVPTTSYDRHSAFVKFQNQITDQLKATFQLNYVSSLNERVPEGYDLTSPIWTVYTAPFTWNPLPYNDEDGNQRVYRYSRNNPYWVLDNVHNTTRNNRFLPVATLQYKPAPWLSITERVGADIYSEQTKYTEAPSTALATVGTIRDRNNNFRQFNHDLIVEVHPKLSEDWDLNVLLGNNLLSTYNQTYQIEGTGVTIDNFDNVSNSQRQVSYEDYYLTRKVGFYAQTNLEFRRMLNLSLTGRYDGSSVLAKENQYYPYGSASVGFIFSEILDVPALEFGKLRASYSSVGNDNIGAYNLTTPYVTADNFPFNGQNGFLLSRSLGNANLVNERTNEFEIGLEMNFFTDRIGLEMSYFDRNHKDLLTEDIPIAPSTGYTSTTLNAGNMTNKGVEALLTVKPVKTKDFQWTITANYTKIKNRVVSLNESLDFLNIGQTYAFIGEPYGTFYTYGFSRNDAGQILVDNTGLPLVSSEYLKLGNIQPDWLGGINNSFSYKNLRLSFFFDMKKGGDILNSDERYGFFYGTPKVTENREDFVVDGVNAETGQTNDVVVQAQDYYQRLNTIAESVIQDGTYIKLRNVSLSYNFSPKLMEKTPFQNASLSVTGRNLWFYTPHFTGSDPEVSSFGSSNGAQGTYAYSVPTSRSYNFTLSLTF